MTLQDRGEKTKLGGVRKPHVGATRGGRSLRFHQGAGGPRCTKCWQSGPQSPSSSRGGWGNPSVRPPHSPPFPFLPMPPAGAGIARGARGRDGAGLVPALLAAAPPALLTPATGGAPTEPARSIHARTQASCVVQSFGKDPLGFTDFWAVWACRSPAHSCASLRLQPNDAHTAPKSQPCLIFRASPSL